MNNYILSTVSRAAMMHSLMVRKVNDIDISEKEEAARATDVREDGAGEQSAGGAE